jgi:TPR repeat protein
MLRKERLRRVQTLLQGVQTLAKCPFCNSDQGNKRDEERVEEVMKRVEANNPASICLLADCCYNGLKGVQQDHTKAMELYVKAAISVIRRRIITLLAFIMKGEI